jgi:2-polyprenyl-3-methyl-5-hydroxy-6-metoxy-1,4-benzoquinol methylase
MSALQADYQTPARMALKRAAVRLPDLAGKRVLDVGCDHGWWCFLAAEQGASAVLGLDRNREVRGRGLQNLVAQNTAIAGADPRYRVCAFERIDLGRQWHNFGDDWFDMVLVMSVYHHVFASCGDHAAIWFWLARHCSPAGDVIFEGPVDDSDPVVRANVPYAHRVGFTREAILAAAGVYFEPELVGPALHEPTREVWRFRRRQRPERLTRARVQVGAGGATRAFEYRDGRRIYEIEAALGVRPWPGSLNLRLEGPFDWDDGYYRVQILDVVERGKGLDVEWTPRWARFYPLAVDGLPAHAFRFEGEAYDDRFMELIAPMRLRDRLSGPEVTLCR